MWKFLLSKGCWLSKKGLKTHRESLIIHFGRGWARSGKIFENELPVLHWWKGIWLCSLVFFPLMFYTFLTLCAACWKIFSHLFCSFLWPCPMCFYPSSGIKISVVISISSDYFSNLSAWSFFIVSFFPYIFSLPSFVC